MPSKRIEFNNLEGEKLAARLDLPTDEKPKAFVLFAHCFTCNKNFFGVKNISKALTSSGFAVLRFDFTGLGDSAGEFENTNFSSNIQDLIQASKWLKENHEGPKLLMGHSLGGAAVLHAAAQIDTVEALVTLAAPSNPEHVKHLFEDHIDEIDEKEEAQVNIGGRPFTIKKQFLEDITSKSTEEVTKDLRKPILIFHSPHDKIVGIENARKIYSAALHPKSFVSLDGADHLLSNQKDSQYIGQVVSAWSSRYLDSEDPKSNPPEHENVFTQTTDSYYTEVLAGSHRWVADEPKDLGGGDEGPSPYELLLSSLGACTGMTLRMYADRKKWPLDSVEVELLHEKRHAEDSGSADKIDVLTRKIKIQGDLDEKQRKRLEEIANKCPIHKTLTGNIQVETEII